MTFFILMTSQKCCCLFMIFHLKSNKQHQISNPICKNLKYYKQKELNFSIENWSTHTHTHTPESSMRGLRIVSFYFLECRNMNTIPFRKWQPRFQLCFSQWMDREAMCSQSREQDKSWDDRALDMWQVMSCQWPKMC